LTPIARAGSSGAGIISSDERSFKMSVSNITPGHVRAFQAVTTQMYGEVTLASCRINGDPGVAIVLMEHVGEGKVAVMPLFVAITPNMDVAFEGEGSGSGGGGGPVRSTKQEFAINRDMMTSPEPS
jgi:hypothetical protein